MKRCTLILCLAICLVSTTMGKAQTPSPSASPTTASQPGTQNNNSTESGTSTAEMTPEELNELKQVLNETFETYDGKAWRTMIGYFFCVIGSVVLSAAAALLLQLRSTKNKPKVKDWSAILAASAAILITINTLVAFNDKWRVDRMAASEIIYLRNQLKADPRPNKKFYYYKLNEIEKTRQTQVLPSAPDSGK
jgi:hypothetical protein